jgi:hypothetical protein
LHLLAGEILLREALNILITGGSGFIGRDLRFDT